MIRKLIKLPFKIAFLPLKIAAKIAKMVLGGGDTGAGFAGAPTTGAPSSSPARSSSPVPPAEPRGPSPGSVQVDPAAVLARLKDGEQVTFIDVREAGELAATGKIEDALHIPLRDLPRRFEELDAEADLVVYCAAGMRSLDAALFLRDKGFEKVFSLSGGLPHWQQDGGEVVSI